MVIYQCSPLILLQCCRGKQDSCRAFRHLAPRRTRCELRNWCSWGTGACLSWRPCDSCRLVWNSCRGPSWETRLYRSWSGVYRVSLFSPCQHWGWRGPAASAAGYWAWKVCGRVHSWRPQTSSGYFPRTLPSLAWHCWKCSLFSSQRMGSLWTWGSSCWWGPRPWWGNKQKQLVLIIFMVFFKALGKAKKVETRTWELMEGYPRLWWPVNTVCWLNRFDFFTLSNSCHLKGDFFSSSCSICLVGVLNEMDLQSSK